MPDAVRSIIASLRAIPVARWEGMLLDPSGMHGRIGTGAPDRPRPAPGLGVETNLEAVKEVACPLYRWHGLGARDDPAPMRFAIPSRPFDPRRPGVRR
jgi:hypothetical protein